MYETNLYAACCIAITTLSLMSLDLFRKHR